MPTRPHGGLITTGAAAGACGVSTQTIVNWIRQGKIKAATTGGGRFRVQVPSLVEFLESGGFTVPAALAEPQASAAIYVIDDDPAWLSAAKRQLTPLGPVETFPDGYRGLVAIVARPPRLVVLDMKMPGLDGAGVLAAIRADPATRDLKILVATRFEEEVTLAKRYGATAAITKAGPVKLRDAAERVLA